MGKRRRKINLLLMPLLLLTLLLLVGCSKPEQKNFTSPTDLEGKRIGVVLARGADWTLEFMEDKPKMEVARYDEMTDILLALKFHKLDGLLLDDCDAKIFMRLQGDGYVLHEGIFPETDYSILFSKREESQALNDEFTLFMEEFKNTEEYEDIIFRSNDILEHPYVSKKVPITPTSDRVIRVAFTDTSEPDSYVDPADGELKGFLVEILSHFANSIGAEMEVTVGNWPACSLALANGDVEVFVASRVSKAGHVFESNSNAVCSTPVFSMPLSLITRE